MKINKICCLGLPSDAIFFLVYFYKVYSVLLKYIFLRPFFGVIFVKMFIFYNVSCFCFQWRFQNRVNYFFEWNLGGFRNKIETIKMIIILCKTQSYYLLEASNPLKIISTFSTTYPASWYIWRKTILGTKIWHVKKWIFSNPGHTVLESTSERNP